MSARREPRRATPKLADLPLVEPRDRRRWRDWLKANHETSAGVWLAVGKKGNSVTSLTYDDAVEEALCFGWIDSTVHRLDEHRFKQLFTPRKPGSGWSRSNKLRVKQLVSQGCMTPAGQAAIDTAKANGSWTALDDAENLVVPEDLAAALAAEPAATEHFAGFTDSVRKMILFWITGARRPETRARRIAETASAAAEGRPPRPIAP